MAAEWKAQYLWQGREACLDSGCLGHHSAKSHSWEDEDIVGLPRLQYLALVLVRVEGRP